MEIVVGFGWWSRAVPSLLALLPARPARRDRRPLLRTELLSPHLLRDLGLLDGRSTAEATRATAGARRR